MVDCRSVIARNGVDITGGDKQHDACRNKSARWHGSAALLRAAMLLLVGLRRQRWLIQCNFRAILITLSRPAAPWYLNPGKSQTNGKAFETVKQAINANIDAPVMSRSPSGCCGAPHQNEKRNYNETHITQVDVWDFRSGKARYIDLRPCGIFDAGDWGGPWLPAPGR